MDGHWQVHYFLYYKMREDSLPVTCPRFLSSSVSYWQAQRADVVPEVWFVLRGTQVPYKGEGLTRVWSEGWRRLICYYVILVWEHMMFLFQQGWNAASSSVGLKPCIQWPQRECFASHWIFNRHAPNADARQNLAAVVAHWSWWTIPWPNFKNLFWFLHGS